MQLSTQELGRNLQKHIKNIETSSMEYGWPGWRGSSAQAAPLPPVATITNRDHHPQKASMLDEVFTALNVLAEGDQNFTAEIEDNKFKDGHPRTTMHSAAPYDGHRGVYWSQIPYNGHHVPSEPHTGSGHLPFPPQAAAPPNLHDQPFGDAGTCGRNFPRSGVNGGIFPSPPFSTSGQVMSPPSHGSFESRPMSAASHPGSVEHHSPNSGYTTPHGAYTPPPSHTPHTPAKSPSSFQNGSSDPSSNDPSLHKDEVMLSPNQRALPVAVSTTATTTGPPPLVPVPSDGLTLAPSMPNSAQVISVSQFSQRQSEEKLAVPPISTLLTPVSANNAPSTMHITATPPISQPENISRKVHTTVLPPLETVIRDDHKRAYIHHLPEPARDGVPHVTDHVRVDIPHLSEHVRVEMIMPDIIQTHACHKCRRIECSCEAVMNAVQVNNIHRGRLQCQRCRKTFSYEKRLEQHLDICKMKGEHNQGVHKSADPSLQCLGCGKQFKSIRWLEWHKENKCSVIDKNAKLEEFRQKVEKLQARAALEARQERGEHLSQHIEQLHNTHHVTEYNSVNIKHEYDLKSDLQCRKCNTLFRDEGLLRGHEEFCQGPITDVNTQGITDMYAKDALTLLNTRDGTGGIKTEAFNNDVAPPPVQTNMSKKKAVGTDTKTRFQCEQCEKSFTLMTNKNRHVRKAHGVQGNGDNKLAAAAAAKLLSDQSGNMPSNQYVSESVVKSLSGDSNTNVNARSDVLAPNVLVPSSKTDNTLLIAALKQSLGHPEQPSTSMIAELLNVINQNSIPVEANEAVNKQSSAVEPTGEISTIAHSASQISMSPTEAANPISADVPPANQISSPAEVAGNIPVPDLTYEDKKHQVVVKVTAAKQNEIMMASDNTVCNTSTTNEHASIAISDSYIESGLGTPSPTFKARGGGGGRGRKRSHMASYDPTSCSSPSQSSDGSTNGDGQSFPTRLHQGRYVCGICDASFTFQTNLTRHQRKLHGKPYVRNPRKGERESPSNRESRSPVNHPEMSYEPSYMNTPHMPHHDTPVYHQEAPIHSDIMLNQESLSNDNTEIQMIEQSPAVIKVESASSNGSPTEHYTDISYESHTIPYSAL